MMNSQKKILKIKNHKTNHDDTNHIIDATYEDIITIMSKLTKEDEEVLEQLNILDKATALKLLVPEEINKFIIKETQIDWNIISESDNWSKLYKLQLWHDNYNIEIQPIKKWLIPTELISQFWLNFSKIITVFEYNSFLYIVNLIK